MKLPRDISGEKLIFLLNRFGYRETRRSGNHIRITANLKGTEHHITITSHDQLKVGTISVIISDVASYLEIDKQTLIKQLFQ